MFFNKYGRLVTWKCFDGQHKRCKGKWGKCKCECHEKEDELRAFFRAPKVTLTTNILSLFSIAFC